MTDPFFPDTPDVLMGDVLDALPLGVAVIDRDLRIVAINAVLEVLTGLDSTEARGVYVDFVLRSNIGQRGRTFLGVLESGVPLALDGDIVAATAGSCRCVSL